MLKSYAITHSLTQSLNHSITDARCLFVVIMNQVPVVSQVARGVESVHLDIPKQRLLWQWSDLDFALGPETTETWMIYDLKQQDPQPVMFDQGSDTCPFPFQEAHTSQQITFLDTVSQKFVKLCNHDGSNSHFTLTGASPKPPLSLLNLNLIPHGIQQELSNFGECFLLMDKETSVDPEQHWLIRTTSDLRCIDFVKVDTCAEHMGQCSLDTARKIMFLPSFRHPGSTVIFTDGMQVKTVPPSQYRDQLSVQNRTLLDLNKQQILCPLPLVSDPIQWVSYNPVQKIVYILDGSNVLFQVTHIVL